MTHDEALRYVVSLYDSLFHRVPGEAELKHWTQVMLNGRSAEDMFYSFINSNEYRARAKVKSIFPVGHYYSPVVDPETVRDYIAHERRDIGAAENGISIPIDEMVDLWRRLSGVIGKTSFPEQPDVHHRFYYDNNIFPYGDAISLRAMMAHMRPRNVIEIGSGFSSACMLDSADEFELETKFTFIDPYPQRLLNLLRKSDKERVTIVESAVQTTGIDRYRALQRNDILFIDSTHVLKTGSDVHFELFHILPVLNPGVIIHFHDVQFPFEYPDQWIFENNHSWNEIYALRAFLMFNSLFRIKFWGSCLARTRTHIVREVFPLFLKNPGGSIWIEKV